MIFIQFNYIYIYTPTIHKIQGSSTAGPFRWPCDPAIPCLRHTPRWAKERAGLEGSHIDHAICACQANFRLHEKPDKNSDPKKELYKHNYIWILKISISIYLYIYINSELAKAAAFRLREVWAKKRRRITQQTPLERLSTRAILGAPSLHGTSSLDSVPF